MKWPEAALLALSPPVLYGLALAAAAAADALLGERLRLARDRRRTLRKVLVVGDVPALEALRYLAAIQLPTRGALRRLSLWLP